ncbi:MAG: YicC family protein [Ectothiorhodospiraceae bacterium]|nr:YicC family protein [Ectothiorhodospiraceae bacterium]
MLISMTGYGNYSVQNNGVTVTAEVKSVNSRFFECSVRLPKSIQQAENAARELIRSRVQRGKINLFIGFDKQEDDAPSVSVNTKAAVKYIEMLRTLQEAVGNDTPITLEHILRFPDVIETEEADTFEDDWVLTEQAIEGALDILLKMRMDEGAEMQKDMLERIASMESAIKEIQSLTADSIQLERQRMTERIKQLLDTDDYVKERLEQEIVLFADKIDITEEIVRFHSHVKFFREALSAGQSEGRKLQFLLQEMNREANTISSKSYDTRIAHHVVGIKEELERIREQVQNIE